MHFASKSLYQHSKPLMIIAFMIIVLVTGLLFRSKIKHAAANIKKDIKHESMTNATATGASKTRKEYLYRLLTNTTRSLIQMEIKARRLEENMRRIKEKTADLLWKNKDKALWHILFKNISRHITIRHEFHQHSSLRRIMQDSEVHKHTLRHKVPHLMPH